MDRTARSVCRADVQEIAISKIEVGWRRRRKLGPIGALAKDIEANGLINPITINDNFQLVCGARRLRAFEKLGLSKIPARVVPVAEGDRLREMELAENKQRLDLDEYEASTECLKTWLAEAEAKAAEGRFRAESTRNPKGGRPASSTSDRAIAAATGVPRETVKDTRRHVEAGERYPMLQRPGVKKYQALEVDELLDRVDPKARPAIAKMVDPLVGPSEQGTAKALAVLRNVTQKPKEEQRDLAARSESEDPKVRSRALSDALSAPPLPDSRVILVEDALETLGKATAQTKDETRAEAQRVLKETKTAWGNLVRAWKEKGNGQRTTAA